MRFQGKLQSANDAGRWVLVPPAVAASFGARRPPVRGTVKGVAFRSRLMVYGGKTYLGFTAAIRAAAGIALGDLLDVDIEADDAPREVDVPPALAAALAARPEARAAFDGLSFTHRKEYAAWIAEAKKDETRVRRAEKAVGMLLAGTKTPG